MNDLKYSEFPMRSNQKAKIFYDLVGIDADLSDPAESWPLSGAEAAQLDADCAPPQSYCRPLNTSHPHWVHDLMNAIIERHWLTPQRLPASFVFRIFQQQLHQQATQQGQPVPKVSLNFLHRKIRRLDRYTVTRCRYGLAAAQRQFLAARPATRSAR
jgi:hypothetical protein